jgi:hypothetical protein
MKSILYILFIPVNLLLILCDLCVLCGKIIFV